MEKPNIKKGKLKKIMMRNVSEYLKKMKLDRSRFKLGKFFLKYGHVINKKYIEINADYRS